MGEEVIIKKMATAGTVESNDIQIMMKENDEGIQIELESVVEQQYGDLIRKVILNTMEEEGVKNARVIARDKGALDFTIRARVRSCIKRGSESDEL